MKIIIAGYLLFLLFYDTLAESIGDVWAMIWLIICIIMIVASGLTRVSSGDIAWQVIPAASAFVYFIVFTLSAAMIMNKIES
jgi:hypothetical protein